MGTNLSTATARAPEADGAIVLEDIARRLRESDEERERAHVLRAGLAAVDADRLLAFLRAEALGYRTVDARQALRLAEAAVIAAHLAGRPEHLALALMAKGDVLSFLGQYQEALWVFEDARRAFLEQGDEVGWARTYAGWVLAAHYLGRGRDALEATGAAYDILVRHQEWLRAAGLDLNRAVVCYELGWYDEALRLYDRAERLYTALGEAVEARAAWAKADKAMILTLLGDFRAALALQEEARGVFVRHGETVSVLRQDHYIADIHAGQGYYTRALQLYNEALTGLQRVGQPVDAAWVALSMVECYLGLNRHAQALERAQEALGWLEACGTPTEVAKARFAVALAHARLGDAEQALVLLDEAARAFAGTGLTSHLGLVTLERARLLVDQADWPAALEAAEAARACFAERGLIVRQVQADLARARALLGLAQLGEATRVARAALATARERELPWLAHECHHLLARGAQTEDDQRRALEEYRAAIASIEHVQSRLAVELRSTFLEDKLQVYHDAIDCCLRLNEPGLAFDYLERAKSRALVDYLANHLDVQIRTRGGANQELIDELTQLRGEHHWFYNRLYGYGLTRDAGARPGDAGEVHLRAAIRDREAQIARIIERLALDRTEGLAVAAPDGAGAVQPGADLDDGTVLLEYFFRADSGTVFVVTSTGLAVVPLAARPQDIRRLLDRWQVNLASTAQAIARGDPIEGLARNARGILAALYQALIAPVEGSLAGYERLIVVPYGPTHAVPFHALHDRARYLIERMEVTVCPSSNLLRLCANRRRCAGHSAVVLAHSGGGRLPYILQEAEAVAALLPGECYVEEAATRAALMEAAPSHRVLHVAAHGEARLDNPTFAHLQLADGQLSTVDVFNLQLDGALVTLSACETGRSVVVGGDELIGLSRGFLYAGAATLVQSLWRVEDGSTARLMAHFYRALRDALPKGAALREAQLALLSDAGAHPYFWAPFQLVGDSRLL